MSYLEEGSAQQVEQDLGRAHQHVVLLKLQTPYPGIPRIHAQLPCDAAYSQRGVDF